MSENGRKRCRKTKLVPRDCAEFIEDDSFLQDPPYKKLLLQKIKKEPLDQEASSALQFSVKVEVEDIADTLPDEDPSDYMQYLFSLSKEPKSKLAQESSGKSYDEEVYIMDANKIHRLLPALLRKYPYEKEAVVATRNSWGKLFFEMAEEFPRSSQDSELQQTINEWRAWYPRQRETPFCYKCYVCSHAWWNFMDFKDHIKNHPDSNVKLEIVQHECNVICFEDEQPAVRDIFVEGKCLKCGQNFKDHLENKRFSDYYYYCIHCSEKFHTCSVLAKHVGVCDKNPLRTTEVINDIINSENNATDYNCQICDTAFLNKLDKMNHLNVCHSVRSDEPIVTYCKICRLCELPYFLFCFHICPKRNILHPCKHCGVKFQNKQMLELHTKVSRKPVQCYVCDKHLLKKCMEVEHYVSHSTNFQVMYRCLKCKKIKLFQGEDSVKNHRMKAHKRFDNRRPIWEKIIVPKLMLDQCLFNPNARARKKIPIKPVRRSVQRKENNFTISEDEEFVINKSNEPAKYYKKPKETNLEKVQDVSKILEQITEIVDLKPDIVKVKEEKDDTIEPSGGTEESNEIEAPRLNTEELQIDPNVSKVFQVSKLNENTDVLQIDPKVSKVFQISKLNEEYKKATEGFQNNLAFENIIVKHEIKEEPADFEDDLIIINQMEDTTVKQETSSDQSDVSILKLEPEVILKAGYRKRKVYKCTKCDFESFHKEYKQHVNNHCMKVTSEPTSPSENNFKCTKCNDSFDTIKRYALHFVKHNCHYMSCPKCSGEFDSITKLIPHLNSHIKSQFLRIQQISDNEPEHQKKDFQCVTCRKVVFVKDMFEHWEGHLEIVGEKEKVVVKVDTGKTIEKGDYALEPEVLKKLLELLQNTTVPISFPKKIKICFVCQRNFERQNDCKRHLIEHLLEDALAKIVVSGQLKCQLCKELFRKPDGYKKHMRDHGSLPIYQCALCDKTFSDSSNFTKHKKIHNSKAFVCDLCHKKFQIKASLEKHMQIHLSTDPYHCDLCDRIFYDRAFFNRHRRQLHEKSSLRFKCFVCKKGFESLKDKWDHMWDVHKHRTNKADCPICKKGYRKYSDVRKHCQVEHSLNITLEGIIELMAQYKKVRGEDYFEDKSDVQGVKRNEVNSGESSVEVSVENGDEIENGEGFGEVESDDDVLLIEEERETLVIYDDDVPA